MELNYTDLLGVPFLWNGKDPKKGLDCWNLCGEIQRRLGKKFPDFSYFINSICEEKIRYESINELINNKKEEFTKLDKPIPFCIVTFMIRPPYTSHMGTILENCNRFIHILKSTSVVIERLDNPTWVKRITGYYEYNG